MIITAIMTLGYIVVSAILSIFPSSSGFPPDLLAAAAFLGEKAAELNVILPLDTMAVCLSIIFGVEISIFGFKTVKWLIAHLPYVGGKGN